MNRIVIQSRVGIDGVLKLLVPVGESEADRKVQVTIDPLHASQLSREEWHRFVLATAGSIADPSFVRHEQGQYECREEIP
ncbi:MAG TPA: hypothetical protein VND64_11560 [Pirellulales bacterium]|nr:hypothetical protein [Pirellulales bacterium]